jgi:hypothetical protein
LSSPSSSSSYSSSTSSSSSSLSSSSSSSHALHVPRLEWNIHHAHFGGVDRVGTALVTCICVF